MSLAALLDRIQGSPWCADIERGIGDVLQPWRDEERAFFRGVDGRANLHLHLAETLRVDYFVIEAVFRFDPRVHPDVDAGNMRNVLFGLGMYCNYRPPRAVEELLQELRIDVELPDDDEDADDEDDDTYGHDFVLRNSKTDGSIGSIPCAFQMYPAGVGRSRGKGRQRKGRKRKERADAESNVIGIKLFYTRNEADPVADSTIKLHVTGVRDASQAQTVLLLMTRLLHAWYDMEPGAAPSVVLRTVNICNIVATGPSIVDDFVAFESFLTDVLQREAETRERALELDVVWTPVFQASGVSLANTDGNGPPKHMRIQTCLDPLRTEQRQIIKLFSKRIVFTSHITMGHLATLCAELYKYVVLYNKLGFPQ